MAPCFLLKKILFYFVSSFFLFCSVTINLSKHTRSPPGCVAYSSAHTPPLPAVSGWKLPSSSFFSTYISSCVASPWPPFSSSSVDILTISPLRRGQCPTEYPIHGNVVLAFFSLSFFSFSSISSNASSNGSCSTAKASSL